MLSDGFQLCHLMGISGLILNGFFGFTFVGLTKVFLDQSFGLEAPI